MADVKVSALAAATDIAPTDRFYGVVGGNSLAVSFQLMNERLDHDTLLNFVAAEHVNHLNVTIGTGQGLSGGGNIAASRTLTFNALTAQISDANFKVINATTLQEYLDQNDVALLNARATGVREGGRITNLGSGVVRISAGAGQILDNTDANDPVYNAVSWEQTDIDLSAADQLYFIYVDSGGNLQTQTMLPNRDEYRTKIFLHRANVIGGVVTGIATIAAPIQQDTNQIGDIYEALGLIKSRQEVSANAIDLSIEVSEGSFLQQGIGYNTNYLSPNQVSFAAEGPAIFRHVVRNGTQTVDRSVLDPSNYDVNNVVTPIPGNNSRATLMAVWRFPSGNIRIFYGQQFYSSITEAVGSAEAYFSSYEVPSQYRSGGILLGFIAVRKAATDLSLATDAVFINTNIFGSLGGGLIASGSKVSGPASSTDNRLALFDGNTGQVIKDSSNIEVVGSDMQGVGNISMTQVLNISNIPIFADDISAGLGGLQSGTFYRTMTGEARVKL